MTAPASVRQTLERMLARANEAVVVLRRHEAWEEARKRLQQEADALRTAILAAQVIDEIQFALVRFENGQLTPEKVAELLKAKDSPDA